jgi:DNA-binding GntR family transcriptional regulator
MASTSLPSFMSASEPRTKRAKRRQDVSPPKAVLHAGIRDRSARPTAVDGNVTERTYERLLELVLSKALPPGDVLEERKLAATLSVSRTPLRSAVNRLLGEGILARLSNGAVVVRETGAADFLELLHIRRLLESEAAALAAGRVPDAALQELRRRIQKIIKEARTRKEEHWILDDDLHDLIAEYAGNKALAQTVSSIRRRARLCNIERVPGRLVPACEEHLAIIDALASGNAERARGAMLTHLANVRQNFLRGLDLEQAGPGKSP